MKLLLSIFILFISTSAYSQKETRVFSNSRITCEYQVENGKMNGAYISKYNNGTKRAEGEFKNNLRSGIWIVYDSTGRKIHQRNYIDHLSFEKIIPEKEKKGAASLFDTSFYSTAKNKDGLIEYFTLQERMVIYASRIWRELKLENNKSIFKRNLLYQTVFTFVTDSLNESYCSNDEDFATKLKTDDLKKYSLRDFNIISWKLKEDFIYDIERNVSESRIIGICPVGVNKKTNDTTDLFWAYYPMLRKVLVKTKVKDKKQKSIKNLEEIFFFRNFSSEVYKLANVNDLKLSDYCKSSEQMKSEQQRIEINLIEVEHEIWLGNPPY